MGVNHRADPLASFHLLANFAVRRHEVIYGGESVLIIDRDVPAMGYDVGAGDVVLEFYVVAVRVYIVSSGSVISSIARPKEARGG